MPRRELREGNAAVALTSPCYNAVRSLFVVRRFHPPPPRPPPPRRTPFQHPSSNAEAEAQCFILTGQQQPGVVLVPSRRNYNSCKCPTLHGFRRNPVITSILVKWGRGGGGGGGRREWGGITRDRRSFCRPRSEFHWTSNFLSHRRSSMRAYIYTFPFLSLFLFPMRVYVFFSPFSSIFPPSLFLFLSHAGSISFSAFFFFPLCVDISFCSLLIRFAPPSPPLCERIRVCPCARGIESPFTLLSISLPRFDGTFDALLYDWLPFFWFFFFSTLFDFGLFFFFFLFFFSFLWSVTVEGWFLLKGLCCSRFQYFWD